MNVVLRARLPAQKVLAFDGVRGKEKAKPEKRVEKLVEKRVEPGLGHQGRPWIPSA